MSVVSTNDDVSAVQAGPGQGSAVPPHLVACDVPGTLQDSSGPSRTPGRTQPLPPFLLPFVHFVRAGKGRGGGEKSAAQLRAQSCGPDPKASSTSSLVLRVRGQLPSSHLIARPEFPATSQSQYTQLQPIQNFTLYTALAFFGVRTYELSGTLCS